MATPKDEKDGVSVSSGKTSLDAMKQNLRNNIKRLPKTTAPKKSATKTVVTPGTKVSQATIDKIKSMGMTKALASAKGASPEMLEGLRRMYGAKRVGAAPAKSSAPKYTSPDAARSGKPAAKPKVNQGTPMRPVAARTADQARLSVTQAKPKVPGKGPITQVSTKKSNTTGNPLTALHNKLSPYGNKSQRYTGVGSGGGGPKTAASVMAVNAKRMGITLAEYKKRMAAGKK